MELQEVVNQQNDKIKGPNAKAPSNVKGSKVNVSRLTLFALEQFGNEVRAEQEEETDAKRTGNAEGIEDAAGDSD
jgi:hypothetical protein